VSNGCRYKVDKIERLLTAYRVGGLPVVGDKNQVIDIVTGSDLFLKEKGMPFSLPRIPRLFRCWVGSVLLMAQRNIKHVFELHENVLSKRKV
jgi:CBS-domain-containing membrane protein